MKNLERIGFYVRLRVTAERDVGGFATKLLRHPNVANIDGNILELRFHDVADLNARLGITEMFISQTLRLF